MHETTHSMISFILFTTSFALISQTSALVSLDNNNNDPLPLLPASSAPTNHTPNTNTIPNTTTLSLPLPLPLPHPPTTSATISYFCSGPAFGSTLNATSCQAAIHLVGISPAPLTFGLRDTGRAYDVTLPQQYISPDGTCVIEPGLAPGEEEARVSEEDVAVAAFVVVRKCAGTGGVARDIGGDNNLRIFVLQYDPTHVRCHGKIPRHPSVQASCQDILDTMPTGNKAVVWGPASDPEAEVKLPALLVSDDRKCKMTIRTTGRGAGNSDVWAWGRFWEVGVALVGMCVKGGMEGVQTGLGDNGFLYMEVGGPQDALLEAGNNHNNGTESLGVN